MIKTRGAADRRKKPPLSVVPTIVAVAITAATQLMDGWMRISNEIVHCVIAQTKHR